MAKILKGYGAAREGAYFKQEQEAELQSYRKRLVKEGKLTEEEAAELNRASRHKASLDESAAQYEVWRWTWGAGGGRQQRSAVGRQPGRRGSQCWAAHSALTAPPPSAPPLAHVYAPLPTAAAARRRC